MLTDSLQVTSMAKARSRAVTSLVTHRLEGIILRIAIGEAVRHQHIEYVLIGEPDALVTRHLTILQEIFYFLGLLALLEVQGHFTSLSTIEIEIYQEIVRRIQSCDRIDANARLLNINIGISHILSIHHQLE